MQTLYRSQNWDDSKTEISCVNSPSITILTIHCSVDQLLDDECQHTLLCSNCTMWLLHYVATALCQHCTMSTLHYVVVEQLDVNVLEQLDKICSWAIWQIRCLSNLSKPLLCRVTSCSMSDNHMTNTFAHPGLTDPSPIIQMSIHSFGLNQLLYKWASTHKVLWLSHSSK